MSDQTKKVDPNVDALKKHLADCRMALAIINRYGNKSALSQHILGVARRLAEMEKGESFVAAGDPLPTYSTCKSTGRGQKDKVLSWLAQQGLVHDYRMDSGAREE